jgi:RNA polymerase nonessential primary-like sigma factor
MEVFFMSDTDTFETARAPLPELQRLAQESLSASLRYDYFSNGKGHKQSKAVLAPGTDRSKPGRALEPLLQGSTRSQDLPGDESERDGGDDETETAVDAASDTSWDKALASVADEQAEAADITNLYLAEVSARQRLTSSEEYRLARRAADGDEVASRTLVEHHLGLVVMIARRYVGRGLPLLDLIEEGNLGLLTAARKFDPELGFRLSTYAKWWIREGIEMALMTQSRVVRIPVHVSRSARQAARRLQAKPANGAPPADDTLPAELAALLDHDDRDGGTELQGMEADDESTPEAVLSNAQRSTQLRMAMEDLTAKERTVIEGRFGLRNDETRTLQAIGEELGLTYERVRQIEKAALLKLRDTFAARGMSWDVLA